MATKKSMYQLLEEMTQDDIKNDTKLVQFTQNVTSVNSTKKKKKVTFEMEDSAFKNADLMKSKLMLVMFIVDAEEYKKRTL